MGRVLRPIKESLPEWFCLSNYDHFDYETSWRDLFYELSARRAIYKAAKRNPKSLKYDRNWLNIKSANKARRIRKKQPLQLYVRKFADVCNSEISPHEIDIRVDLHAPNKIIVEELRRLLQLEKSSQNIKDKYSLACDDNMNKVILYKIIPLADLFISELEENCRYTSKRISRALGLGDDEEATKQLDGAIKDHFNKIIESRLLEELEILLKLKPVDSYPPKSAEDFSC